MMFVFVLNGNREPLNPVHPAVARMLLRNKQAAVFKRFPFTLILKEVVVEQETEAEPLRLKLDPGSKTTGIAIVNDATGQVVFAAELTHRGQQVRDALLTRCQMRRNRRSRKTRYRPARFLNRTRPKGWLPPSLESRLANVLTWVYRFKRLCPIGAISQELVKFDMQLMENASAGREISGIEYQQGTLAGYEVRQYLLEKWGRKCAYCGNSVVQLQIEHISPRARGGSNRVTNLTLACEPCNTRKGTKTALEFGFPLIQAQARKPLKDAAAVNATRKELLRRLEATGLPVETGTGGMTKYNRTRRGLAKTHWLDAACVGASTPENLQVLVTSVLEIKAKGQGQHCRTLLDKYGFPRLRLTQQKKHFGFQTGDIARAVVTTGKKRGVYNGRVAVNTVGRFNISTLSGVVSGLSHRFFKLIQHSDGYGYQLSKECK
ncbi:MAG: RNA-guided endonuclease IscB [Chloroflexota bacterium]